MNNLYKYFLFIICLSISNVLFAQDKGTIRGTIIEDASGDPLYGVTILVKGTESTGTTTDFDGKFDLDVPAGTYDLRISYVSYRQITVEDVEVKSGEVTVLGTVRLQQSVEELDEVVVRAEAITGSEAAMITKKKKLPNLIDGISAENFGKIGVSDAAEALKKVTGVSIQGGKYVYVRGLGDRYTNTMLNSVEIPSLDPTRNSLQIDIFPTNLINNMVVTKTAVAEMPADFTGGIVNIETKDFPERPIFELSASVSYNPDMHLNSDYLSYSGSNTDFLGFDGGTRSLPGGADDDNIPTPVNGSSPDEVFGFLNSFSSTLGPGTSTSTPDFGLGVTVGNQFELANENKLGYIFTANYKNSRNHYSDFRYGEFQISTDPDETDLIFATRQNGVVSTNNILLGGLAGVAYKTQNSKYKLTGMHLQNGESKASQFFINNSQSAPGQSGFLGDSFNLEYGERKVSNILLTGTHFFDDTKWEIDWRLSPTFSNMDDPDTRRTAFTRSSLEGGAPTFNAGAAGVPSRLWRFMDEVNLVSRVNITREYELFGELAKFKFGGSHVYKQRDYKILQFDMAFFGNQPEWTGDPSEVLSDENLFGNGGTIYFQSGNPDPNPNAYSSNVNNSAAYVSNEFILLNDLKASIGLRAEKYVQRHTGRDARYAQGDRSANNLDNEKVLDALDFFPSANLTYFLADDMNLRFSYSRTIARPTFRELSFAQILDPVSDRIFNGGLFPIGSWDGNLHETRINNFDLRWEKFFRSAQLLSFSVFYKTFDDPIELVRIRAQVTSNEYQPRNVGDGQVYGAELEVRKSFDFLSSSLANFGVSGNFTLVKSVIEMTDEEFQARKDLEKVGQTIDDTREMAGQSPYIINAGLTYDNPDLDMDAGFFYNVRGETLIRVGGGLFPDVYTEPFHSLNFNLNKSFGAASVNVGINNILNQTRSEFYEGFRSGEEIFEQFNPGRTASIGIKYSF